MLIYFLLELSLMFSLAADFRTRVSCATEHLTTSYVIVEYPSYYELTVMHHNGLAYMPIHNGITTIADLDILKQDAKLFEKMGARSVVKFDKNQCVSLNNEWHCSKKGASQVGELKVNNLTFRIQDMKIIISNKEYDLKKVSLSFNISPYGYTLPMEYSNKDCLFYN